MQNIGYQYAMAGLKPEQVNQMLQGSEERFRPDAEKEVKANFIFQAIATAENIEISDENIEEKMASIAEETNRNIEAIKALYEKENALNRLKDELLDDKVLDFLIDNANVEWEKAVGKGSADEPNGQVPESEEASD